VDLGFVKLTMTHALHSCGIKDGDELLYGGEAAGYVLTERDGRTAYFAGDTALFSDMVLIRELYGPELAFLPIGDHYTMGPLQACHAARLVKPRRVVPMHYGTFPELTGRPEELAERLRDDDLEVWPVKQGETVEW
jgi:L-ascorbate metabolism protein UlaG (beta-lactamase superfamily)